MKHSKALLLLLPVFLIFVYSVVGSGLQQRDLSKLLWEEIVQLSFQPAISGSHLTVPVVLNVDVLGDVKPREVIVRARVTGAGGDNSYVEIAKTSKTSRGPTGFERFKVPLSSCETIGTRLEVEAIGANNRYKVYSRSFECTSGSAPPNTDSK